MLLNPFKGKNIVITGGSRGIGLEMARQFARNGANLALIARGKDDLNAARETLESEGGGIAVRAYAGGPIVLHSFGNFLVIVGQVSAVF